MRTAQILLIWLLCFTASAQEKGTGPKEKSFKTELKTNKKFRLEQREKRRKERAERKAIKKYHKRLQTKKVRKRMKANRKKSMRINDNRREPAFKRWFQNRRKGGKVTRKG